MMASSRHIEVRILADTRELRRAFLRAELATSRSFIHRLRIRVALWRLSR